MLQPVFRITALWGLLLALQGCLPAGRKVQLPVRYAGDKVHTGSAFYRLAAAYNWKQRDSLAMQWADSGFVPPFLLRFRRVEVFMTDSITGKKIRGHYFVSPDYFSVGNKDDWARVPLTPMAGQYLADKLQCFLPTRKMVDDIYRAAEVKPEPVPMYALRDSTPTMWQHHLIIEGQRKGKKGLVAGIKKDVVISARVSTDSRPNRVAIYGWHKPDGRPIQPLYTGHVNWYVDYSHGIRLVYQRVYINGKPMHYADVLQHPVYRRLLCDEDRCDFLRYAIP